VWLLAPAATLDAEYRGATVWISPGFNVRRAANSQSRTTPLVVGSDLG